MSTWYVASTRPHQESRAELNLRRQGFDAWLPRLRRKRRHARRTGTVFAPLFPGYLFVRIDPERQPWRAINSTYGVRHLICQDSRPAPVPEDFISSLRGSLDEDGVVAVEDDGLKPGVQVRLLSGPFFDCIGKLLEIADRERVSLLLSILGREVKTTVSRRIVALVD